MEQWIRLRLLWRKNYKSMCAEMKKSKLRSSQLWKWRYGSMRNMILKKLKSSGLSGSKFIFQLLVYQAFVVSRTLHFTQILRCKQALLATTYCHIRIQLAQTHLFQSILKQQEVWVCMLLEQLTEINKPKDNIFFQSKIVLQVWSLYNQKEFN